MENQTPDPRESTRLALYERLRTLNKDEFRTAIRREKDDHLLGDLRYDFNWDPDPRKSSWQAIEINRVLTDNRARREAFPQWIGIVVGNVIALAALAVSIIALYKK